ncbi:PD-(D/E)XK nuclease family protein [Cellulomonas sp. ATA003]|nr:PD-(D/E)XK nuclease family protein [Cellulomonas sp. ATA003]WNB86125.1 PD-(D/E)XK nuclease family protein [Cellulomonas sp. ATA003]
MDEEAARLLARLARAGVDGADPAGWYGLAPVTTDAPLWTEDEKVPVSPSKAETVSTCALRWALEAAGGTVADGTSQTLGTLVHAIAQALPRGTEAEMLAELDRRWPELGLRPGWPSVAERRRAERMVGRLAAYVAESGDPVLREAEFSVELDRAVLRGVVDRVEDVGEGVVRIVDLKTGKRAPSAAETDLNPQLGSYQLAVAEGRSSRSPRAPVAPAHSWCSSPSGRRRRCARREPSRSRRTARAGPGRWWRVSRRPWPPPRSPPASTTCARCAPCERAAPCGPRVGR